MKRLVQAAMLTLLLQLIAQLYPSSLTQTTAIQRQGTDAALLAWDGPELRQLRSQMR